MTKSSYAWVVVALLWFIWLLNYLDRQIIFSVFPLLYSDLKLSDFELGLLSTSFLWVYALASPAVGYLRDRFSRKKVILASLLVWSLMTWATGKAKSFHELLWARSLMGVSEAAYLPAGLALIADHHSERAANIDRDRKAVRLLPTVLSGSRGNSVREGQAMHMRHASILAPPPSPGTHGTQFVPSVLACHKDRVATA
jgi:MFS family permease